MPRFDYLARGATGEAVEGVIAAPTASDAARLLRGDGKFIVRITEALEESQDDESAPIRMGGGRIRADDVIFFAAQMAVMVDTGVSITEALSGIIEQTESQSFRRVLEQVLADVETGMQLSVALAKHPRAFSPMFVSLVKASEVSGRLGTMLDRCAGYMSQQRETRRRVVGAMIYPLFLMVMSIGVVIFLLTYLMPKFIGIYAGREQALPVPTKVLIGISGWLSMNWMWWVGGLMVVLVGSIVYLRTARGRRSSHWLAIKIPLFGGMLRKTYLTRTLRTLGTLIEAGVSVLDAVGITREVVRNSYFQQMWDDVDARVQMGEQLSVPLSASRLMPRFVTQMINAGERSGHLSQVLERVCGFLDADLEQTIKRMTQMIEPVMIVFMGIMVGGIAIALLLPIFTISRIITH
jgi:type II secretory pathway component PulF